MTIRHRTLKLAVGIFLILLLLPITAHLQEQTGPPTQQQENPTAEPTSQQSGQLITPENTTSTELENQKPDQHAVPEDDKQIAESEESAKKLITEETAYYTVKKGDTLWDISNAYLKDPFLWPFIWKENPAISNPDLIYPGNKFAIPSLAPIERALKAPASEEPRANLVEKTVEEEKIPQPMPQSTEGIATAEVIKPKPARPVAGESPTTQSRFILPEEQPIPIIDKYAMLSAGFVNSDEMNGRIVGARDESQSIFSFGDIVYVKVPSAWNANIGDKFLIYAQLQKVSHPKSGRRAGRLIRGRGILQITAKDSGDVLTAKITLSFDGVEKGNMLTPYQEPALIFNSSQKAKDILGYVLEVTDERVVNGQLDFVYLDKGSMDGVEPGDRFIVYNEPKDRSFPRKRVGEVQVFIVKDQTSTAVVRISTDPITRGDKVELKK
jgi:hypothetical protein